MVWPLSAEVPLSGAASSAVKLGSWTMYSLRFFLVLLSLIF